MGRRTTALALACSVGIAACLHHEEKHIELREYQEPPAATYDVWNAIILQFFHVLGFTSQDILAQTHMDLMRRLITPTPHSSVVKKAVEVYFIDPFITPDEDDFEERYGDRYQSVYFYNETALALSKHHGITLPPVIDRVTRAELPQGFGTSIRHSSFMLPDRLGA